MVRMAGWIAENWFNTLSALGIIGSLLFTGVSLRSETKTRRIANLLVLTQNHRELWSELFAHPKLRRVLDPDADITAEPVTIEESYYVNMIIQHLNSAFEATKSGLVIKPEGITQDVRWLFSLTIPREIWEKLKALQNNDFVAFIEDCLKSDTTSF
jgi:hypothetical protein